MIIRATMSGIEMVQVENDPEIAWEEFKEEMERLDEGTYTVEVINQ